MMNDHSKLMKDYKDRVSNHERKLNKVESATKKGYTDMDGNKYASFFEFKKNSIQKLPDLQEYNRRRVEVSGVDESKIQYDFETNDNNRRNHGR
jgi:hypothetical protein